MINVILRNLNEFSKTGTLKEMQEKMRKDHKVCADGHTGNTFDWSLDVAKNYCNEINKIIYPKDSYYAKLVANDIDVHTKRLTEIMSLHEKYWIAKPITFMYDDDFLKLLDENDLSSLKLFNNCRDEKILGYIYFRALNNLHEKKICEVVE